MSDDDYELIDALRASAGLPPREKPTTPTPAGVTREELLPCPWCGETPVAYPDRVECTCGANGPGTVGPEWRSIAAWNRRAPQPPVASGPALGPATDEEVTDAFLTYAREADIEPGQRQALASYDYENGVRWAERRLGAKGETR